MGRDRARVSGTASGKRDRDHRYDRDATRQSPRSSRGEKRSRREKERSGRRRSSRGGVKPPRVPDDFRCHICRRGHWTVECDKLRRRPEQYPLMNRKKGCWRCAQEGHNAMECRNHKYLCKDCGGLHDTKDCIYDHKAEEWYEFVDPETQHVFYTNSDESQVQWVPPTHELDTVLWYCPSCRSLIPSAYNECLKCHEERPASALPDDAAQDRHNANSSSSSSSSHSSDRSSTASDDESSDSDSDSDDESDSSSRAGGDAAPAGHSKK